MNFDNDCNVYEIRKVKKKKEKEKYKKDNCNHLLYDTSRVSRSSFVRERN